MRLLICLFFVFNCAVSYALPAFPTKETGYKTGVLGASITADTMAGCRLITNTGTEAHFVPTQFVPGWNAFMANTPAGITVGDCTPYVAYYTMDHIAGNTLVDETGTYDGTIIGNISSTVGYDFNGLTSLIGDDDHISTTYDYTDKVVSYSFWTKTPGTFTSYRHLIGSALNTFSDSNHEFFLSIYADRLAIRHITLVNATALDFNRWYHVVFIANHVTGDYSWFLDGTYQGSGNHAFVGEDMIHTFNLLGFETFTSTYSQDSYLDEVKIYERALITSEIEELAMRAHVAGARVLAVDDQTYNDGGAKDFAIPPGREEIIYYFYGSGQGTVYTPGITSDAITIRGRAIDIDVSHYDNSADRADFTLKFYNAATDYLGKFVYKKSSNTFSNALNETGISFNNTTTKILDISAIDLSGSSSGNGAMKQTVFFDDPTRIYMKPSSYAASTTETSVDHSYAVAHDFGDAAYMKITIDEMVATGAASESTIKVGDRYSLSTQRSCSDLSYSPLGYTHFKGVQVQSTSGALTDHQILVELDTAAMIVAGTMKSASCFDVRFKDAVGTSLDYFLERSTCNTSKTKYWVKIPSLGAQSTSCIFAEYGAGSSTIDGSSGVNTFAFFDNFAAGMTKWTNYGSPVPTAQAGGSAEDGYYWESNGDATNLSGSYSTYLHDMSKGAIFGSRIKQATSAGESDYLLGAGIGDKQSGFLDTDTSVHYMYSRVNAGKPDGSSSKTDDIVYYGLGGTTVTEDAANDYGYHTYYQQYLEEDNAMVFYRDSVLKASMNGGSPDPATLPFVLVGKSLTNTTFIDWVFVAKYDVGINVTVMQP